MLIKNVSIFSKQDHLGVTFEDGIDQIMEDAVTMKAYNGASRSYIQDNGNIPGFYLNPSKAGHYCYWYNAQSVWALSRYNSEDFNYVLRVCEEVE